MDMAPANQENPDQVPEQPGSHALVTRILKLRWMRMDDEAKCARIALQKAEPRAIVLPGPIDTD
jgi:hypothetical protein